MEFMLKESKRDESIHVQQEGHGNSSRISRTWLLVRRGASGPTLSTGRPVMESMTIFAFRGRVRSGVNITPLPCSFASSESPG